MTLAIHPMREARAAADWVLERTAQLKAGDALAPVTILVPTNPAGLALRRRLAAVGYANVRTTVAARLCELLGAPRLAAENRQPLTRVLQDAAVRTALARAGGFEALGSHRALLTTMRRLFTDLRRAGLSTEAQADLPSGSRLATAAMAAFDAYLAILEEHRLYDVSDLVLAAAAAVDGDRGERLMRDTGPILGHLVTGLHPFAPLLLALSRKTDVELSIPVFDDDIADAQARLDLAALGVVATSPAGPTTPASRPVTRVLVAPDAAEEVRAVCRMIAADLEAGVPLHRVAVVYRSAQPYAGLVRETLAEAELPSVGLDGRPLTDSNAWVARGLLGLLALHRSRFARTEVLNWMSGLPPGSHPGTSVAQWDRITRAARIVRDPAQWEERLGLLRVENADALAALEREEAEGEASGQAQFLASQVEVLDRMLASIRRLAREATPPVAPGADTDWPTLVGWARHLRDAYLAARPDWPEAQVEAGVAVDEVLAGLSAAASLDTHITLDQFLETLEDSLRGRRRSEGRLGTGVVMGTIASIGAMDFDRVYVVGMGERSFPLPAAVDPLFPDTRGADPLRRRVIHESSERRAFLAAMSSAAGGRLMFSMPRFDADVRPVYPSRWLLDEASMLAGRRLNAAELREMPSSEWMQSIASADEGLAHSVVMLDVHERRTAEIRAAAQRGQDLRALPIAGRADLPIGRALHALDSRRSSRFTEYDGNLEAVAAASTRLQGGISAFPISPTGIETWATCPFRFLLGRVLHVEPTERPEDEADWSIDALTRGSLIHRILDRFFRSLAERGRPRPEEAYTDEDRSELEAIAREEFDHLQGRGQTGYALAWANEQASIELDLVTLLRDDAAFRREHGVMPGTFEQAFGYVGGWPAVEVPLADGDVVRLRGYIDRVDFGPDPDHPQRAYVTDYKTGREYRAAEHDADPVVGGRRIQLAAYSAAVRGRFRAEGRAEPDVTAAYWFASHKGSFHRIELTDATAGDRRLQDVVTVVGEGVRRGAFPQVPGAENDWSQSWENCRYCDYQRVCPTGRDQLHERKRGRPGADLHERLELRPGQASEEVVQS